MATPRQQARDKRYSIELEWCGAPRRRWIVRFEGGWIAEASNRPDADKIAREHAAARLRLLTGEEAP